MSTWHRPAFTDDICAARVRLWNSLEMAIYQGDESFTNEIRDKLFGDGFVKRILRRD